MSARLIVGCSCAVFLLAGPSRAADNVEASGSVAPSTVTAAAVGAVGSGATVAPWIHPKIAPDLRERLQAAVRIAVDRIERVEECGALFSALGADGVEMLATTLYIPVSGRNRKDGICRRAAAYTKVGARSTFVCPEFSLLSDDQAAMFVVHEALHHAGLTEQPLDPRAMTSLEINTMVGKICRF
jgi:hypothetical protein